MASLTEPVRAGAIAGLASDQPPSHFTPFRGGYLQIPVIRVPHELLIYRVENGRLIAELEEHVRSRGLSLDALAEREEAAEVQELLHGFLAEKAADPRGPVLQELRRQAQQTEPLLITAEGVLVNGNRRLAAMRQLLAEDPDRYAGFAEVSAAVLPADARAEDVESVEAALQLAPETKLAYGWINRRLKLRRQLQDRGLSREAIADAYRFADPGEIDRELRELALAELYLDRYLGEAGRYSQVADCEALFVGLAAQLALLPDALRPCWRMGGFCMIHGREAVAGPMDRHFPFADPAPSRMPAWALRRFAEEHDLAQGAQGESAPEEGPQDLEPGELKQLKTLFADVGRSAGLAKALFDLMERLRAEFQEEQSPARTLKLVGKLNDALRLMQPDRLSEGQRRRLRSELAAVQAQAAVLLGKPETPSVGLRLARLLKRR